MSSRDEQWWDIQAAEYVLGSLTEQDRIVFEKLLERDADARQAVLEWQTRLDPLNLTTAPVQPPTHIFDQIAAKIEHQGLSVTTADSSSELVELKEQVRFWKTAMFASLATAAALAASLFLPNGMLSLNKNTDSSSQIAQVSTVSVLEDEAGQPVWAINYRSLDNEEGTDAADQPVGELVVSVVGELPLGVDVSPQLWMVLADGSGVESVGLIPYTPGESIVIPLPRALDAASSFAVSLEAAGGTTEPAPVGVVTSVDEITFPVDF